MIVQVGEAGIDSQSLWMPRIINASHEKSIDFRLPQFTKDKSWWIAIIDGKFAGFAGTTAKVDWDKAEGLFVGPCGVLPEFRGRGLQRKFLKVRERYAIAKGYTKLVGSVETANVWSGNNFIRCGYELDPDPKPRSPGHIHFRKLI